MSKHALHCAVYDRETCLLGRTAEIPHILYNQDKLILIEDHKDSKYTVVRMRVEDEETANQHEHVDMTNDATARLTTGKTEKTFEQMLYAFRDTLSHLASCDNVEYWEDKRHNVKDTLLYKQSEDN